jgi:hypothetical protein
VESVLGSHYIPADLKADKKPKAALQCPLADITHKGLVAHSFLYIPASSFISILLNYNCLAFALSMNLFRKYRKKILYPTA